MRRMQRIVLLAMLVATVPVIAGCSGFDPEKLDVFGLGEKKKLPGDRQPLFPEGVPGVTQGVPPEYIKGNQPPPDTALALPTEPVVEPQKQTAPEEKPKPKRTARSKPKPKTTSKPNPAAAPAAPQAQPAAQQPPPAAWPAPTPAQSPSASPWPAQQQSSGTAPSTAPWPSAPPPGTFSR